MTVSVENQFIYINNSHKQNFSTEYHLQIITKLLHVNGDCHSAALPVTILLALHIEDSV